MPDLTLDAATAWVRLHEPGAADAAVREVEHTADVKDALQRLGLAFDTAQQSNPAGLSAVLTRADISVDLGRIMAQLGLVRVTRLLGWLVKEGPPDADQVVTALVDGSGGDAATFLEACLAGPERPALLDRLYSTARLTALSEISAALVQEQEAA